MPERVSYTCSLITQGTTKFYSLAIPSDVLGETCFVSTRDDDPIEGFQRVLNQERAKEIADYIDNESGSIPTAIILSAQKDANLEYSSKTRTLQFDKIQKAFMILDGQHRVYGFSLANTSIRVPVIIYNNLSRKEETRLFIDINTKQKPVPSELLLDIKSLAEYDSDIEAICRNIFDLFNESSDSVLLGLLVSNTKSKGKISRVTFNAAVKPIYNVFGDRTYQEIYEFLNAYLKAMTSGLSKKGIVNITKPVLFRAIMQVFPHAARLANGDYSVNRFYEVLVPLFDGISPTKIAKADTIKVIYDSFMENLIKGFVL